MNAAAQLEAVVISEHGRIPVVDIGPYLAGETGAAARLARAIARTFEDTGFLVVANHGVPPHLIEDTFAAAAQFFARPAADKLALKIGEYNIGYLPFGGQVVRHSPVNNNTKPNFSESFYITRDRAPDHPDIINQKPLVGLNRWPPDMPAFRAATTAYYAAMEAMTRRLVPVVAVAVGSAAGLFRRGLCRAELHDPANPLPVASEPGGERVRLRPAHGQQFPDIPRAVGIAGPRGAHRGGRVDSPAGGAWDIRRQYRGDAGALFERPLPGDPAPRYQPEWRLAIRDPILPRAKPRFGRRVRPDLHRPRQPAAL